jgi:hypothetical protein
MKRIETKMVIKLQGSDFDGKLHYIKLTSEFEEDLCIFEYKDELFVLTNKYSKPYDQFNEIMKMNKNKDSKPDNALATLIQCVNSDGSVSPMYFEDNVFAMPYRIKSDSQLQRYDDNTSFSVDVNK